MYINTRFETRCDATTHHWEFRVFALGWSLLCRLGIHDTLCGWFARLTKAQPQPGSLLAGTDSETSATRSQIVASAFGSLHNWLVQVVQNTGNLLFCHRLLYNLEASACTSHLHRPQIPTVAIVAQPNIIEIDRYFYAYHDCQEDSRLSPDQLLFNGGTNRRHLFINFLFESEKRTRSPSNIFNWTNLQPRLPSPSTNFPMIVCQ